MNKTTTKTRVEKICPKCGYDDVTMQYYPKGKYVNKYTDTLKNYPKEYFNGYYVEKEFIRIHCRTCHYEWLTDTIDH